jgi:hypothetical protein
MSTSRAVPEISLTNNLGMALGMALNCRLESEAIITDPDSGLQSVPAVQELQAFGQFSQDCEAVRAVSVINRRT